MLLMDIKNNLSESDNRERIIKESLDSDAAGDAYYKVNEVALKLQEVKPYIEEGSKQEVLYNKIMIDLNDLQVSFTEESINESHTSRDRVRKSNLNEDFDQDIISKLRSSKYYNGEGLVQSYIELQRQKDELEKQGKLTDALRTKFDDKIQELINKSEYAHNEEKEVVADIPDEDLPVDLASKGRCPYCTRKMSKDEYRVFGMCKDCYDNGVE